VILALKAELPKSIEISSRAQDPNLVDRVVLSELHERRNRANF
jgi:hypothetical protein